MKKANGWALLGYMEHVKFVADTRLKNAIKKDTSTPQLILELYCANKKRALRRVPDVTVALNP
jgi:hypothetical protein